MTFKLHPQLEKDCYIVGSFALCEVLMTNNSLVPWFILVPKRAGVREIFELSVSDQQSLLQESNKLSRCIMREFKGEKLNVAALGNVVPDLHIHHVVRFSDDEAWPAPVWGNLPSKPYEEKEAEKLIVRIAGLLDLC